MRAPNMKIFIVEGIRIGRLCMDGASQASRRTDAEVSGPFVPARHNMRGLTMPQRVRSIAAAISLFVPFFPALVLTGAGGLRDAVPQETRGGREPLPFISTAFPATEDVREPDLTIRPDAGVRLVSYDGNGRQLATVSGEATIRLWDARTGEQGTGALVRAWSAGEDRIVDLAPGTDATSLMSLAADGSIAVWNTATGELTRRAAARVATDGRHALLLPGKTMQVATWSGARVRLWNPETGSLLRTIDLHLGGGRAIERLAISPDQRMLATGSDDGTVRIWESGTGTLVREIPGGPGAITAIGFDPRGEQIAAAGASGAIDVWDTASGARLCVQRAHRGRVASMAFASNGQKMASGGEDGTARTWTVPLPPLPRPSIERIDAAAARATASGRPRAPRRVLVFWRADAILHKSGVPAVNHALEQMGRLTGAFEADFSRDFRVFDPAVLARYDAIVLNSTAHLVMPEPAKRAYLDYVDRGGGVMAVHAAIDTFLPWPEGAKVVGATFGDHPWGPNGTWAVKLDQPDHRLLRAFHGRNFTIRDELYVMGEPYTRADRRVLLSVDLSDPATAAVNLAGNPQRSADHDFALAWIKDYGRGRVFYADFGHIDEPFWRPEILQFYLDGLQYVVGDLAVER